jgi:hypothetical protein
MATNSLPQSTLDTFQPISASAVHVLARMAARKAVQEELRDQGVRVSLVRPAEISVRAQAYLQAHPELYREALERAQRLGMYEKVRRRPVYQTDSAKSGPDIAEVFNTTSAIFRGWCLLIRLLIAERPPLIDLGRLGDMLDGLGERCLRPRLPNPLPEIDDDLAGRR